MKKILSLLMLLVTIVIGAKAADETIFLWQYDGSTVYGDGNNNGEFAVTATTGTAKFVTYEKKKTSADGTSGYAEGITDNELKPNITKVCKLGNNGAHIKISPASGKFKAGDIIYVCGYESIIATTSSNPTSTSDIRGSVIGSAFATGTGKAACSVGSLTLPANFTETDAIYLSRSSSSCGIAAIKVVRPAPSTDPVISAENAEIKATESGVEVTKDIAVSGANLTGSTLTATLSGAPTGMSVALDQSAISAGAISATATVSYTATENANGTATLTFSDGTTTKDVTITYKAKVTYTELKTISDAHTWDIVNDVTGNVDFTGDDVNTEFVYADIDGLTFNDNFDEEALSFKGQYPRRTSRTFAQAGVLHFKTSVPGTITVKFSDTGSSASSSAVKRYLRVNGENTEYWASRENNGDNPYDAQLDVTSGEIPVEAGDVYIDGSSALIYYFVTFTPAAVPTTETITIPSDGVLTYVTQNALDFSTINGAFKAYVPTSVNEAKTSVATAEVTSVPAGTALLLKGAEGSYDVEIAESATAPAANLFQVSDGSVTGGDNIFAYSKSALKFKKVASTVTIPAGKCYLTIAGVSGDALDLDFDGEATAVDAIAEAGEAEAAPVKVIKNGKLYIGNFNVAGQQVK